MNINDTKIKVMRGCSLMAVANNTWCYGSSCLEARGGGEGEGGGGVKTRIDRKKKLRKFTAYSTRFSSHREYDQ